MKISLEAEEIDRFKCSQKKLISFNKISKKYFILFTYF